jgi:hypothetical protein|tara:strand:+ start:877 stop:1650 length:774 start_codon:yes stop_codon:yes gene_type:complete
MAGYYSLRKILAALYQFDGTGFITARRKAIVYDASLNWRVCCIASLIVGFPSRLEREMNVFSLIVAALLLSGCMKVSDMAEGTRHQLRDVGILDHSETVRSASWRLQPDSFIYIAQGHFVPPGGAYPRPNVVAEEAFESFVQYFPLVRRAPEPVGLEEALNQAAIAGAHYLLYTRFAAADDRIGSFDEFDDQRALDRLGVDTSTVQLMLIETGNRYLADTASIRSRGGLLNIYDATPQVLLGPPLRDYARRLIGLGR